MGIELGSGGALNPVEVIPPEALKSLLELEDRVTMLSTDVNELKIVNAALLITLFTAELRQLLHRRLRDQDALAVLGGVGRRWAGG